MRHLRSAGTQTERPPASTSRPGPAAAERGSRIGIAAGRAAQVFLLVLCTACGAGRGPKETPPPISNQQLYEQGRGLVEERKYIPARKILTEIGTNEVQDPALDPLVKITIADSYYFQPGVENLIEAQSRYNQFVSFYPSHALAGYAQFQIAMCDLKQSPIPDLDQTFTKKAMEELDKVEKLDSTGRWVAAAQQMKRVCLQKIARHDYQVGVFYYKRKAYSGAVSRFKKLLEGVPEYPGKDGVYYYLGVSLLRSMQDTEGRIYLEKLVNDFPASRYTERAKRELSKI